PARISRASPGLRDCSRCSVCTASFLREEPCPRWWRPSKKPRLHSSDERKKKPCLRCPRQRKEKRLPQSLHLWKAVLRPSSHPLQELERRSSAPVRHAVPCGLRGAGRGTTMLL